MAQKGYYGFAHEYVTGSRRHLQSHQAYNCLLSISRRCVPPPVVKFKVLASKIIDVSRKSICINFENDFDRLSQSIHRYGNIVLARTVRENAFFVVSIGLWYVLTIGCHIYTLKTT